MEDKVLIASFHDQAMQNFRLTCPEVATSAARGEVTKIVLLGKILLSGFVVPVYQSIQPPYDPKESMNIPIMTRRFIHEAHVKISNNRITLSQLDLYSIHTVRSPKEGRDAASAMNSGYPT